MVDLSNYCSSLNFCFLYMALCYVHTSLKYMHLLSFQWPILPLFALKVYFGCYTFLWMVFLSQFFWLLTFFFFFIFQNIFYKNKTGCIDLFVNLSTDFIMSNKDKLYIWKHFSSVFFYKISTLQKSQKTSFM